MFADENNVGCDSRCFMREMRTERISDRDWCYESTDKSFGTLNTKRKEEFAVNVKLTSPRTSPRLWGRGSGSKSPWSSSSTVSTDYTFHQLAPYIGRMKTSIARWLV